MQVFGDNIYSVHMTTALCQNYFDGNQNNYNDAYVVYYQNRTLDEIDRPTKSEKERMTQTKLNCVLEIADL